MNRKTILSISLAVLLASAAGLQAQTTWTGNGTDSNWNTPGNWDAGVPDGSQQIIFDGTTQTSNVNNITGLTQNATIVLNATSNWTLSGNAVVFNAAGGSIGTQESTAANPLIHTVNFDIGLTNAEANRVMSANTATTLIVAGDFYDVSGTGGTVFLTGSGVLRLTGNSSSSRAFHNRSAAGIIEFTTIGDTGVNSSLGTNALAFWGGHTTGTGTFRFIGTGNQTSDRRVRVGNGNDAGHNGGLTLTNNGTGALNFTNATFTSNLTTSTATRALTLGGNYTGTNTVAGTITNHNANGATALTVSGSIWQLDGNHTYTGNTTVSGGTLLLNGSTTASSTVSVASGGTLGGNGTIGGNILVESGGILSPGNSIDKLTVGQLTLADGANLVFGLTSNATAGTTYDQIDGTSLILSGGTVNLTLNGIGSQSIALNDTFTLFTGSVTNFGTTTFSITNNTDWTGGWQVSEGSLIVTAIPEPSTWALLAGSLTLLTIFRRRRA